jgi:hypothetical protein
MIEFWHKTGKNWYKVLRTHGIKLRESILGSSTVDAKTPSKSDRCRWRSNKILITTASLFCLIISRIIFAIHFMFYT